MKLVIVDEINFGFFFQTIYRDVPNWKNNSNRALLRVDDKVLENYRSL